MANVDHHFVIGHAHSICQDYAASATEFAALADGCSCVLGADGKPQNAHTDIGARLLVRAAFHHAGDPQDEISDRLTINTADAYRRQLGLDIGSLSATLLTLKHHGENVQARISGDGLIAARKRGTSEWVAYAYQFNGPPYYLRYMLPGHCRFDGRLTVVEVFSSEEEPVQTALFSDSHVFDSQHFDLIVAASDGIFSFTRNSAPLQFDRVLATRLLDFRRLAGQFVKRHLCGVLRELAAEGIVNQDDISMIAIHV